MVVVLDHSGSMKTDGRLDVAREATKTVMDTLTTDDRVGQQPPLLYCTVLCCVALRCVVMRCVASRRVASRCVALHRIVLLRPTDRLGSLHEPRPHPVERRQDALPSPPGGVCHQREPTAPLAVPGHTTPDWRRELRRRVSPRV